jgi:hypothetical protein
LEEQARPEDRVVLLALAEDLAGNFILVVELPTSAAGTRSLVKLKHEGDIGESPGHSRLSTVHQTFFDGAAWSSTASWHVEVHAPPGLAIHALVAQTWDADQADIKTVASSPVAGHTAHVSGPTTVLGSLSWAILELRPARAGLVNQVLLAAAAAWLLLTAGCLWASPLYETAKDPNRASAVAAVMLAVPALLIALVSRGYEHGLVSRLLLLPRLVNLAIAGVLLGTAAAVVLGLTEEALARTLLVLWLAQTSLVFLAYWIWRRSVGGHP